MRKLLCMLIMALFAITAKSAAPVDVTVGPVTYRLYPSSLECSVYSCEKSATEVEIAQSITHDDKTYSVTSIGNNAFIDCSPLTDITIPNSVTYIGDQAFYGCSSLTSITIPNTVTSIGYTAFSGCSSLTSIAIPNSVTSIEGCTFYDCSSLTSIIIPNTVTSIGYQAFHGCSSLTDITISANSIGYQAFCDCSSLTGITILNSVTIQEYAFSGCTNLKSVFITDLTAWCRNKFKNSSGSPLYYDGELFLNGEKVVNLVIPEGITTLNFYQFGKCSSIESVIIPEGMESIGKSVFNQCKNLKEVYLSSTVKALGAYCFYKCSKLETVYCAAMLPPVIKYDSSVDYSASYSFAESYPGYMALHVPVGSKDSYSTTDGWKEFGTIINDLPASSGIDNVTADSDWQDNHLKVYNLQGVRIPVDSRGDLHLLPDGIYIVNGVKYIVK